MNIFHLAIPSRDLNESKNFYTKALGAKVGREYKNYIIFNIFGHQVVTHLNPKEIDLKVSMYPRHYGIVFDKKEIFDGVYEACKKNNVRFFEDQFERYKNDHGWHFSFFISDPSNNLIEIKYYVNKKDIFN